MILDNNSGSYRPSSAAFDDDPDGQPMSVFVERLVRESGRSEAEILEGHTDFSLAALGVEFVRQCNQKIAIDHQVKDDAHRVVVGQKTYSIKKRFYKNATWVILTPPNDSNPPN